MLCRLAAVLSIIVSAPALAIEGRYRIEGSNPGNPGAYQGEVIVRKTGATYTLAWQLEQVRQIGTGLLSANVLSVTFMTPGRAGSGVASFEVENDKVRRGTWTALGAQVTGTETWTPQ
jgi:hypothetical protein